MKDNDETLVSLLSVDIELVVILADDDVMSPKVEVLRL